MKKIICLVLCLAFALTCLASCNGNENTEHAHTFAGEWSYDETNHWHNASCEHTDEKTGFGEHTDADGNDICDTCGYIKDHTHTYESAWTVTESTHYYKSTCGHEVKKDEADHVDENNDGTCDVCAYNGDHVHTYSDEWSFDNDNHWHAVSCGHDVEVADNAAHTDADKDGICDICSSDGGHTHTYADSWSSDENHHWKEVTCDHDIDPYGYGVHTDENTDSACDTCAYLPEHIHTFEETLSSDKDGHYYKSTCGHDDIKKDFASHDDSEDDGVCNTCSYVIFHRYEITVNAPQYIKVEYDSNVKEGTEVIITITVPDSAELLEVIGASAVGSATAGDKCLIYKYKIAAISKDTEVTVKANSLVAAELITDGEGSIPITNYNNFAPITFNAPYTGKYVIYSYSDEQVSFGHKDASGFSDTVQIYVFEVDKAGSFTVSSRYFSMNPGNGGSHDFSYYICFIDDDLTLKAPSGSGYTMPTNAPITVTYTVPKAGMYQISSSVANLAWNDDISTVHLIEATEDGQTITFTLVLADVSRPTFDFDWQIERLEYTELKKGDNQITIPLGKYQSSSFTATESGAHRFTIDNAFSNIFTWNDEYKVMTDNGSELVIDLEKGDVLELYYFAYDIEGGVTADIKTTVKAEVVGRIVTQTGGYYVSDASSSGKPNTFINGDFDGEYAITAPENALLSLDGTNWSSSISINVKPNASITYYVKSSDNSSEVNITISRVSYEFNIGVGTSTVTMQPGVEYTVSLSGFSLPYYTSFVLSWDNADVTIYYSNTTLTSGTLVSSFNTSNSIAIVLTADSAADVTFTLVDPEAGSGSGSSGGEYVEPEATLVIGSNAFFASNSGVTATFTAVSAGDYTLSAASGESNAMVHIVDDFASELIDLPYEFTLAAGESISFVVTTGNFLVDEINLTITKS